ncbi:BnaC03g70280D [Brassica napus]|uniref:BnaC03g70280D protein n=2 Tax=Brassica TaxID=3705 RepID=A0A078FB17_BRANA|nr:PREDICTED: inactive protein kinase SELMODRAFT_444075 isoform X1 [Brassica oleracea var. oleracea]XP_013628070.1 PREDICTED: inactive protein kinase SELMODRAFT_444075 isoform X1 [Brassica oleracea var. oleracea]XP_048607417.1 inactive protein kinase SELMODRAFT_444075 isoform X2 [Brassica napus]CDY10586.1 BnaC03g70280D [Brassica napus]
MIRRKREKIPSSNGTEKVLVAVKASREISKTALVWALTHIVHPGDCITLVVVVTSHNAGRKLWTLPKFAGDCASGHRKPHSDAIPEIKSDLTDTCSQMILQLHDVYDPNKVNVRIKIVSGSPCGAVASEAKESQATWVVLDKHLKQEVKRCIDELQCNIVAIKRSQAKVLRFNLVGSPTTKDAVKENKSRLLGSVGAVVTTPFSSPEVGTPFTGTEAGTSSVASSDLGTSSPIFTVEVKKDDANAAQETKISSRSDSETSGNIRGAVSLSRNAPPVPPPLCSICQHKAPVFGKPPRFFSYKELELATKGFSQSNFLAEGGFGSVHRGVLPEGQIVAVKQHKLASTQGDVEFCSEVEVLSCAQHRNVVMLIGFCIEESRRLLVYEYICNGSLDGHLYGRHKDTLEWPARQKIAVGAARGLRYLHEECRVGCIVHRDLRPNNILITHDYEPLVGDFGLARWQPDGELGVDTRIIGTFGYLAPEYTQSGQITEKADVYSFGVVLIELITGRKAMDISRPKGQQCLSEWARSRLEEYAVEELVDPKLEKRYSETEIICMIYTASLCIRRDPHLRPRMSQVLRLLEGDMVVNERFSGRLSTERSQRSVR